MDLHMEDLHNYWMRGPEAHREVQYQRKMEQLDAEMAEIERRFEKVRAVPCNCELLDAHQCYADKHGTSEGDDSKYCRCRCHWIAEQENLVD